MKTREELEKVVEAAAASWAAVDAANAAYDAYAAGKAYAVWCALNDAQDALKAYDKKSNDSFHNFAECLCESYQREELVKAVYGATEADLKAYNQARLMEYNAITARNAAVVDIVNGRIIGRLTKLERVVVSNAETERGQREWVGLTDEEFHDLQIEHIDDPWANFKAIEAKLKEKNT